MRSDEWPITYSTTSGLTEAMLLDLLNGRIAALRIPGFVDATNCAKIVTTANDFGYAWYENVLPPIGKIGLTQIEHGLDRKQEYFGGVVAATEVRDAILREGDDPFDGVMRALASAWSAGACLAYEDELRHDYFAGVIRNMGAARLHVDWAPHDAVGWDIAAIEAQLAWNIYLQIGEDGGATRIYRRPWTPELERYKTKKNYGYEPHAAADADIVELAPRVGELVVFSPRNLHEVTPVKDPTVRISVGSFIGCSGRDDELSLWS